MRKGSTRDIIVILTVFFALSLFTVAMYGGVERVDTSLNKLNSSTDLPLQNTLEYTGGVLDVFGLVDVGMIVFIGAFFVASVYSAMQVSASRMFVIPSLLFLIASLYMAGVYADSYKLIASVGPLQSMFNSFPTQIAVFDNLGVLTGVLGLIVFIATYWNSTRTVSEVGL